MGRTRKEDFELEPDPVWRIDDMNPTEFFLKWWETVAERRYGDRERWIDVALELGYVGWSPDTNTGQLFLDVGRIDYEPELFRATLEIPNDMPIIWQSNKANPESYRKLWDRLLGEVDNGKSGSNLG